MAKFYGKFPRSVLTIECYYLVIEKLGIFMITFIASILFPKAVVKTVTNCTYELSWCSEETNWIFKDFVQENNTEYGLIKK